MRIFVFIIASVFFHNLFSQSPDTIIISRWNNKFPKEVKIILDDQSYQMRKYYFSGGVQCEINYDSAARLNGPERCWFESGTKKSENYWHHGVNTRTSTYWYPNGQKSFEAKYSENGAPDGAWKGWYENGQIQYEQSFINGVKEKKWITYRKDGGVESIQHYENGIMLREERF